VSGPAVTLIGHPVSPYVRKILAICAVKGIEAAIDPITPFRGDDTFSTLSPLRRIPVWIEGDLTLCDSSIIAQYIEDTRPTPALLPEDPKDRARARWIEEYADTRLFDVLGAKLFFQLAIKPRILKEESDLALVEKARTVEIPETFDYLETLAPEDGYLFGAKAGLADFSLAPAFLNARMVGLGLDAARWPRLAAWLDRVERETPLAQLNAAALALMMARPADYPELMQTHGLTMARRSVAGDRAMRGPLSPA
jgi:glutathione S-transferase